MEVLRILTVILVGAGFIAGCILVGGISLGLLEILRDIWKENKTTNKS